MNILVRLIEHIGSNLLGIRILPRTIQLPITNYCNSKCKTCNIWKIKHHQHIEPEQLKEKLRDPFFRKVISIGINGGEPSLHNNFAKVMEAVLVLPRLKDVYVISNGMRGDILLSKMKEAKALCSERNVRLHLTLSLDGYKSINDYTRGVENAYDMTMRTIQRVKENKDVYCDVFDVGYTISRSNSTDMVAVKVCMADLDITPYYHIAVPNKRINTFNESDYSILNDTYSLCNARDFFYGEYVNGKNLKNKFKSFINFYYLKHNGKKRIAMCNYLKRDITIDEKLNVYLCATASEMVGCLKEQNMQDVVRSGNLDVEAKKIKKMCNECIHYAFSPNFYGLYCFIKEKFAKINILFDLLCARLHI